MPVNVVVKMGGTVSVTDSVTVTATGTVSATVTVTDHRRPISGSYQRQWQMAAGMPGSVTETESVPATVTAAGSVPASDSRDRFGPRR